MILTREFRVFHSLVSRREEYAQNRSADENTTSLNWFITKYDIQLSLAQFNDAQSDAISRHTRSYEKKGEQTGGEDGSNSLEISSRFFLQTDAMLGWSYCWAIRVCTLRLSLPEVPCKNGDRRESTWGRRPAAVARPVHYILRGPTNLLPIIGIVGTSRTFSPFFLWLLPLACRSNPISCVV